MLLVIILLLVLFGGFGSYRAYGSWGPGYGGGIGIGTILICVLIWYLLSGARI
jgi:hypothetical protein